MKKKDIKILLVDDEPDILEIVSYNLANEGYQIFTASNGIEAVKKSKEIQPHLILLDVMMPQMDGIEACAKIRENDNLKEVIIAFFTARGEDYSQLAGFDAGADDYITKPVKPKVLVSKINSLLRRLRKGNSEIINVIKIGNSFLNGININTIGCFILYKVLNGFFSDIKRWEPFRGWRIYRDGSDLSE